MPKLDATPSHAGERCAGPLPHRPVPSTHARDRPLLAEALSAAPAPACRRPWRGAPGRLHNPLKYERGAPTPSTLSAERGVVDGVRRKLPETSASKLP